MKALLVTSLVFLSSFVQAQIISFVACSGDDWKITNTLDLDKNMITITNPNGTDTYTSSKPIQAISSQDVDFLNIEGAIPAKDIESGYKVTTKNPDNGHGLMTLYFINLKGGGQALVYGSMLVAGPCKN